MKRYFALLILLVSYLHGVPTITGLTPAVGPSEGNTSVTITGSGFTGTTQVHFGTTLAANFTVISDTTITATTPPHAPQVVPVTVTTPSGTSAVTVNSQFTYQGDILGYVTDRTAKVVTVVDLTTNMFITSIPVGTSPDLDAITPDGTKVYVSNYNFNNPSTVSVIDTATNVVISTISVGNGPDPIAITPDGTKAFVGNFFSDSVSVIDTVTDVVIATITVGDGPACISITPDGKQAYVANFNTTTISVIDIATLTVSHTITVGSQPFPICITPDGTKAYVGHDNSGGPVSVIDTATNSVIATIPVGENPDFIAITPNGAEVYVANLGPPGIVSVISTISNTVIATINISNTENLVGIVITPDGTKAYVDDTSNNVSVINTTTHAIVATVPVSPDGGPLFIIPDGTKVLEVGTQDIGVINTADNSVSNIVTGVRNVFMAVAPDQAPLANFTANINSFLVTFDASASASPTGDIVLYTWNFGDGTTSSSMSPFITHVYATTGLYIVTLTVKNSAGTSTQQIYNFSSNGAFWGAAFNNSQTVLRNGGPTATLSLDIVIGLAFQGCQVTNKFLTYTELENILFWQPLQSGGVIGYNLYRDAALTDFIAFIPATGPLRYEDHNRRQNQVYTYYLVAILNNGTSVLISSTTVMPLWDRALE